jgi:Rv2258c-like winged HTH domain
MSSTSSPSSSNAALSRTIDNEKLQQFMAKILSDFGVAASAILVYIGDKLGLYKAMSDFGKPITSQELANLTGTAERYIREWLANQAAGDI